MAKKITIATIAVFVAWMILDYVIHEVILSGAYGATSHLWRPMEEMKNGLMVVVSIITALAFVYIYADMIANKSMATAVKYGLVFGLGFGVSFAYGTYSVMPIPYSMAITWFLGTLVETAVAGVLLGLVFKDTSQA